MNAMTPALETEGLAKNFGALQVARDINFSLPVGARYALIGPNGAGKTSFINLLTGVLRPNAGHIRLGGSDVTGLDQAARVKRGIARTFQITSLFNGLTVADNVALAVAERRGLAWGMVRPATANRSVREEAMAQLDSLQIAGTAHRPVRELPYGQRRLVEIALALALKPRVLLLDEPAAGIPSHESGIILDVIATLPPEIAILIIEHDMDVVFRFAERITVLVGGAVLVEGTPAEIADDPRVREVYLGETVHV
jgi:ABC-type branched-subunit amino acid transport system ATPase component